MRTFSLEVHGSAVVMCRVLYMIFVKPASLLGDKPGMTESSTSIRAASVTRSR